MGTVQEVIMLTTYVYNWPAQYVREPPQSCVYVDSLTVKPEISPHIID